MPEIKLSEAQIRFARALERAGIATYEDAARALSHRNTAQLVIWQAQLTRMTGRGRK
jgi:hypothetical protein